MPRNKCKNCDSIINGKFCSCCGQKVYNNKDKLLSHLIHEAFHIMTNFDGKIFNTIKSIYRYPGCQAIEDAYVLGKLLDKGISIEKSFAKYESLRCKKAHMIVNKSWTLGKTAHIELDFGIWLRNIILMNMSKSANKTN